MKGFEPATCGFQDGYFSRAGSRDLRHRRGQVRATMPEFASMRKAAGNWSTRRWPWSTRFGSRS